MESDSGSRPASDEAAEQLDQLDADERWAGFVRATPESFQMLLTGACILSVILFAVAHVHRGPDPDSEGLMALVSMMLPFIAQGQVLHDETGSWLGTPGKRPQRREVAALAAAYVAGLVAALLLAARGVWPGVVVVAIVVGVVAAFVSGRWIGRFREEHGFRTMPGLWRGVAVYVVFLCIYTFVFSAVWHLISAWWPDL